MRLPGLFQELAVKDGRLGPARAVLELQKGHGPAPAVFRLPEGGRHGAKPHGASLRQGLEGPQTRAAKAQEFAGPGVEGMAGKAGAEQLLLVAHEDAGFVGGKGAGLRLGPCPAPVRQEPEQGALASFGLRQGPGKHGEQMRPGKA